MDNNNIVPDAQEQDRIVERLGDTELRLDEVADEFVDAIVAYVADLANDVPLPEAQLGLAEYHLDEAWRLHDRIGKLRSQLDDPSYW